jgi:hypothetical protein
MFAGRVVWLFKVLAAAAPATPAAVLDNRVAAPAVDDTTGVHRITTMYAAAVTITLKSTDPARHA